MGRQACISKAKDRPVRQAVITHGKNEGWVVFSIDRVARLAVKYAYPAQNIKRINEATRLRERILFICVLVFIVKSNFNKAVMHPNL